MNADSQRLLSTELHSRRIRSLRPRRRVAITSRRIHTIAGSSALSPVSFECLPLPELQLPDIHAGLQTQSLMSHAGGGVQFTLAMVTHGRDQMAYGLHSSVTSHFLGGVRQPDFLERLGFRLHDCEFVSGREAYCLAVDEGLDVAAFANAFGAAFDELREASRHLKQCGFYLDSRNFPAKDWARGGGDGHRGTNQKRMKESDDKHFEFVFSWLEQSGSEGWTIHYRATEQPPSAEMESVLKFLGLRRSEQCVEFDFEPCRWRHVRRDKQGDPFGGNTSTVHGWFDAHPEHFAAGIEHLLSAQNLVRPFGMGFLQPSEITDQRAPVPSAPASRGRRGGQGNDEDYDVAISFAGTERAQAEELALCLRDRGVRVFYDGFLAAQLWGKDLAEFFDDIYRRRARYCVMFVSEVYRDRMWTTLERRSAIARSIEQREEYILPVVVEQVDLSGLPPTLGYVSAQEFTTEEMADMVVEKLRDV